MIVHLIRLRRTTSKVVHFWTFPHPLCRDESFRKGVADRLTEWDRCTRPADHEGACA